MTFVDPETYGDNWPWRGAVDLYYAGIPERPWMAPPDAVRVSKDAWQWEPTKFEREIDRIARLFMEPAR